jgi:hypothetical protein
MTALLSLMLPPTQIAAGVILLALVFYDLFQAVVLPRPAVNKAALVRPMLRTLWRLWRLIGGRIESLPRRERWLATFGPISVLFMFGVWALALILAYALVLDGVAGQFHPALDSFGTSLYFSATTLVPLSYGDLLPEGVFARLVTIAESASGVFLAALAITLLFSLYESFQEREELVVTLDAMAGAPPSGVRILETAAELGMRAELIKTFDDWRKWAAAVLESHLAYPTLLFFRSSHDNEAWLNSFGAVMDAAILVISAIEDDSRGPAKLMMIVGRHLVEDLAWYFGYKSSSEPYVEREEFTEALARLERAGYSCRPKEEAWEHFSSLRSGYAYAMNQMAKRLAIIPAQWIGDRSYLPHRERTARRGLRPRSRR